MGGIFAEKVNNISHSSMKVLKAISSKWPASAVEVAEELGDNGNAKRLSAKYLYHFKKLHGMELIQLKKAGNTYIAWPTDIEKLRVIHELVR